MKKLYQLVAFAIIFFSTPSLTAQTFWDGPTITFTKAPNADWTQPENQDRITDSVWITRQDMWSIFNIQQGDISVFTDCEEDPGQPYGTEWAWGSISDGVENLTFDNFLGPDFIDCAPGEGDSWQGDSSCVLHLIAEDIYIDVKWLSWGVGGGGGGSFSYERSTEPVSSVGEIADLDLQLYPNPAGSFIQIEGVDAQREMPYRIMSVSGATVDRGIFVPGESIGVENLSGGLYFVQLGEYRQMIRFVKF